MGLGCHASKDIEHALFQGIDEINRIEKKTAEAKQELNNTLVKLFKKNLAPLMVDELNNVAKELQQHLTDKD